MLLLVGLTLGLATGAPPGLPEFRRSAWFDDQVREQWLEGGVRVLVNAARDFEPKKPTRLVIYATPNGNTIEQTLGCGKAEGLDWHFDIQHVAAQVRKLREQAPNENLVLACIEADGLSWPAWKKRHADGPARARKLVETIRGWVPDDSVRIALAGHSGGGSFLFGFIDGGEAIPASIDRLVFLDANYSFSDADKHGDKMLTWLKGGQDRRLVVIAYDDREIVLDGKKVIGPDGGTYRATERMRASLAREATFAETVKDDIVTQVGLDGRIALIVHTNPKNRILHTALIGEMNGLVRGLTDGGFGAPRSYAKFIQPVPAIPKRPADAVGGAEFFRRIDKLPRGEREDAVAAEILRGNIPDFLRSFTRIEVKARSKSGKELTGSIEVMPDYLAIGSDADFVRVPMTPLTAARIADAFGCALPTRKLVDDIYRSAAVKLEPKPLTENREAAATFLRHHTLIEEQRDGKKLGALVAGIKKDVVVTNRLAEKPDRVAIYGWHTPDGKPIQPLTIVHVNWYVDYSHGVRLVKRNVLVDGKARDIRQASYAGDVHALFCDEGPLARPAY